MRKFKRLASIALAAVMTLAMCAPAFAANETKPTYDVYQIFTGDYVKDETLGGEVLSNIKWGANGTGTAGEAVDKATLEELATVKDVTDNQTKLAVVTKYVNWGSIPHAQGQRLDDNGQLSVTVDNGYYLVKTTDGTVGEGQSATTYVVQVTGETLTVKPKTGVPTVDKKIVDDEDASKPGSSVSAAAPGSVLTFKLTGTMPDNIDDYKSYYYTFTDTMSTGLTYKEDTAKVTVGGTDVTESIYVGFEKQVLTIGTKNLKDLGVALTKDTVVTVTYQAVLGEGAATGTNPNTNEVYLTYSNDPNKTPNGIKNDPDNKPEPDPNDPISETVKGTDNGGTKTYITGLTVTDKAGAIAMEGAEFTLAGDKLNVVIKYEQVFKEDADGTWYKLTDGKYTETKPTDDTAEQYESTTTKYVCENKIEKIGADQTGADWTATVGTDGTFTISGLNAGEYTLTQKSAPAGYNLVDPIKFTIGFDEQKLFYCNDNPMVEERNEWFYIELDQRKGTLLPETGGVGTTLLYIGGMLLFAVAGATLILKGKKSEDIAE